MTNKARKGLKDIWNAFMLEGAIYTKNDIPYCPTVISNNKSKIIKWEEANLIYKREVRSNKNFKFDYFVCFYIDDYKFDGFIKGIWHSPTKCLKILKHFRGIITPDFSTYLDFPDPINRFNTYRMRAFGYWISKQRIEVINNVRWGYSFTYSYCFDGIDKNSIVAIGTVGGSPRKAVDRERFESGLIAMVQHLQPHTIIVYGSANYSIFDIIRRNGITVVAYPSHTFEAFRKKRVNHE